MSTKNSNDPRAKRTRQWLQTALRELMEEKPYQKIKVSEITQRAEVSRPAFYLHYVDKDDLLMSLFDDVLGGFRLRLTEELSQENIDLHLFCKLVFVYWGKNADALRILLDAGIERQLLDRFRKDIHEMSVEVRTASADGYHAIIPYVDDFLAGGGYLMLRRWIEDDMVIPAEMIGHLLGEVLTAARDVTVRWVNDGRHL
ncbi:MAG: TetR/AcrR family transcriptional regulator [Chloroflexota bacterium]